MSGDETRTPRISAMCDEAARAVDWEIPGGKRPIDSIINKYIRRNIRDDFVGNPYKAARRCAVMALARAELAKKAAETIRRRDEDLKQSLPQIEKLADHVRDFLAGDRWFVALTAGAVRGTSRPRTAEHDARWKKIDAARRAIALSEPAWRTISREANRRLALKESRGEDRDDFMAGFIEPLTFCWKEMSARELRPASRHFAFFVGAAVDTLVDYPLPEQFHLYADALEELRRRRDGAKRDSRKTAELADRNPDLQSQAQIDEMWGEIATNLNSQAAQWTRRNRQIAPPADNTDSSRPWALWQSKIALEEMVKRDAWDRPDRTVKDLWPRGRKSKSARQVASENEIRSAIRSIERGGDKAEAAAAWLANAYSATTAEARSLYLGLGFHPEVATALRFGAPLWSSRGGSRKPGPRL